MVETLIISGVATLVSSGLGAWFLRSKRETREQHHRDYERQQRQRRLDLYVDVNELICVSCENTFFGPLPILNGLPTGCPHCKNVDLVALKVKDEVVPVVRPKTHIFPDDTHLDAELYSMWRQSVGFSQDKIRDQIVGRIDCKNFARLTPEQRMERAEIIYRMWELVRDSVTRDCILNLYDNNTRRRIQSKEERQLLLGLVQKMANNDDFKSSKALANQGELNTVSY